MIGRAHRNRTDESGCVTVEIDDIAAELAPRGLLRASINLGNPVLAQGGSQPPSGITVDIARELARRLDVPLELLTFDAARKSLAALTTGAADVGFLAVDPARAAEVAFTAPYVTIEGVFVVPRDSEVLAAADVDVPGRRVGVKEGSAYDLHLSRTLERAEIVRGAESVDVYVEQGLEVGAGIRQPVVEFVEREPGHRVVEPAFMQIHQAVTVPVARSAASVAWLRQTVEELRSSGFVAASLAAAGQSETLVAAPA